MFVRPNLVFSANGYGLRSVRIVLSTLNVQLGYHNNVVGQMLLHWGIERADALGIEFWTFSDDANADLYRVNGMQAVSAAASFSVFCGVRRRAEDNRERYKDYYLDTGGFW